MISCSEDSDHILPDNEKDDLEIRFSLNLPGLNKPQLSKALTSTEENKITELDILVFDVDIDNNETFSYHVPVTSAINKGGTDEQELNFSAWLKRGNDQNVVVIANARSVLNTIIASIPNKGSKANILKQLIISHSGAWPVNGSLPMPMYSESGKTDIHAVANTNPPINMQLIRMLARIDVKNSASGFELQEVYLCNASINGYISPVWDEKGNVSFGKMTANLPPSFSKQSLLTYPVSSGMLEREIYTFESAEATDDNTNRKNATCLVLKGIYNGQNYYYRVDFTYADPTATDPSAVKYMPLLRNYKYEIDITQAHGIGYSSVQEAIDSYTVSSNLKTRVLWYDEAKAKDINYNGQYMIALTDDSFIFEPGVNNIAIDIRTDYPKGWEIDPDNGIKNADGSSASSWLSVNTYSGTVNTTPVSISVADIPQDAILRVGYIEITSGRLKTDIEIIQTRYNVRESSNCYMIAPKSSIPLLIPVGRAETAITGNLDRRNDLSSKLLWTDNQMGIGPDGSVQTAAIYGKSRKAIMVIEPGATTGNAVIAAQSNGEIKWSWHIWTTDYTPAGNIMDRNLGSLDNGTNSWWESRGLFYQWGRKDPFPYAYKNKSIPNPAYPEQNQPETIEVGSGYYYDDKGSQIELLSANIISLAASVKQPDKFTTSNLWHGSDASQSWNTSGRGKSLFDPCPSGWRIPSGDVWNGLDLNNFIINNTIWNKNQSSNIDYGSSYDAGRFAINANDNFYPAQGQYVYDTDSQHLIINDVAICGYYWTNEPHSSNNNEAHLFRFTETLPKDVSITAERTRGFSIRCIKE